MCRNGSALLQDRDDIAGDDDDDGSVDDDSLVGVL